MNLRDMWDCLGHVGIQTPAARCWALLGITVQGKNGIFFSASGAKLSYTEMHTPSGGKEPVPAHLQASAHKQYTCYVWMLGSDETRGRRQYKSSLDDSSGN